MKKMKCCEYGLRSQSLEFNWVNSFKMSSWQNGILVKWQTVKIASWWYTSWLNHNKYVQLTKWQVDNWQVDKMATYQLDKITNDKEASWQNDQILI